MGHAAGSPDLTLLAAARSRPAALSGAEDDMSNTTIAEVAFPVQRGGLYDYWSRSLTPNTLREVARPRGPDSYQQKTRSLRLRLHENIPTGDSCVSISSTGR